MDSEDIQENNRRIKELLTFIFTAFATICIGFLLSFVPEKLDIEYIQANYIPDSSLFLSERAEKLQYMICTVAFPLLYIGLNFLMQKTEVIKVSKKKIDKIELILFSFFIIGTIFIFYVNPFYLEVFNVSRKLSLNISLFVFCGILGIMSVCMAEVTRRKNIVNCIIFILAIAVIFYSAWLYITNTYYFGNLVIAHHFDAYFYPVYKVFSGQTPLVDFKSIYGLYPLFLYPVFKLVGGITMLSFSIVMAALVFICFLVFFIALWKLCNNKMIVLISLTAIICWMVVFPMQFQGGPWYLQYIPHRLLFPAIVFLLCVLQSTSTNVIIENWLQKGTFAVVTIAILWNFDTGLVVALAYPAFLVYRLFLVYCLRDKVLYKKIASIFCESILSIVGAYILLVVITFIRSGVVLNLTDFFYGQTVFYKYGFFMLKMPLWHQWILLITVYSVALVKAIKVLSFIRKERDVQDSFNSIYFLLSVLGLGIFSYYQGRSHNFTFVPVCWPAMIILTLFVQDYFNKPNNHIEAIKRTNKIKATTIIVVMSALTGVFFHSAFNSSKMAAAKDKHFEVQYVDVDNVVSDNPEYIFELHYSFIDKVLDVIVEFRHSNEPLNLIMYNAAAVYTALDEKWIAPVPATIDWFKKSDCAQVVESLRKVDSIVIFDEFSYDMLNNYDEIDLKNILSEFYQKGERRHNYYIFIPKSFESKSLDKLSYDSIIEEIPFNN